MASTNDNANSACCSASAPGVSSPGRPKLAAHTAAAVAGHSTAVARAGDWDESA